jgi:hypothetical protein
MRVSPRLQSKQDSGKSVLGERGSPSYHLVTPANEDGHGACVRALLDDEHPVPGRTEGYFAYHTCLAELCCRQILKAGHDPAFSGNCDQLGRQD